jgi:hypothetical protein
LLSHELTSPFFAISVDAFFSRKRTFGFVENSFFKGANGEKRSFAVLVLEGKETRRSGLPITDELSSHPIGYSSGYGNSLPRASPASS